MDCMMAELKACESELYESIAGILAISIGLKRSILREGSQKSYVLFRTQKTKLLRYLQTMSKTKEK